MDKTPLQEAVWFFYERLGNLFPIPDFWRPSEGTCFLCGIEGEGYFDQRASHQCHRCPACSSFYAPAPEIFLTKGKDRSFAGVIKNLWVLDAEGRFYSPVGEQTNKGTEFLERAAFYGMDFSAREGGGKKWLTRQIFSGNLAFPLLWGKFGQNKPRAIQSLHLSTEDLVCCCEEGQQLWYDRALIEKACNAPLDDPDLKTWWVRGLPDGLMERAAFMQRFGGQIPKDVLTMPDEYRRLLKHVLPDGYFGKKEKKS